MLGNVSADEWIADLKTWLTQKRGRADEERLGDVLRPLADLTERLSQQTGTREIGSRPRTPIDLMQIIVEIRNKTTGHHAYGSEFWSTSVQAIVAGADLLSRDSPLWSGSFVLPLERRGKAMVRLLEGVEPEQSVHVPALANDSGDFALVHAGQDACRFTRRVGLGRPIDQSYLPREWRMARLRQLG